MNDDCVTTVHFHPMPVKNLGRFIEKFMSETAGIELHEMNEKSWAISLPEGDDWLIAVIVCDNPGGYPSHYIKGDAELVKRFLDRARHNQRIVPRYSDRIPLSINVVK